MTLTYSKLGKPLFSTRIIECELNPVFEETAILKVDVDIVKLKEQLSLQLWDSDRVSAVSFLCESFLLLLLTIIRRMT